MLNSNIAISVQNITAHYPNPKSPGLLALRALFGVRNLKPWHVALDDISFNITKGENVGILGRNGAGKSTLLSIISKSTEPNSGNLDVEGSIAAVLSLGRGMNPQLTGRENAFLFARSIGASSKNIKSSYDDIQEFSELGDAFDRPMRTYSSGMRARLSFSTAIAVDSDILILDETLSVGDLNFRMKCYDMLQKRNLSGKTIILVAHNPTILARFCERILVLDKGQLVFDGPAIDAVAAYKEIREQYECVPKEREASPSLELEIRDEHRFQSINQSKPLISIPFEIVVGDNDISQFEITLGIVNTRGTTVSAIKICSSDDLGICAMKAGERLMYELTMDNLLSPGNYRVLATGRVLDGDEILKPVFFYPKFSTLRIRGKADPNNVVRVQYDASHLISKCEK